jgi:hypothetical protein
MNHSIHSVHSFEIIGPFTLRVEFGDGISQNIDFSPVLLGQVYGPLQDPALFNKVQIDPETHTLVWPNGADFDPATLHDWPLFVEELAALSRSWVQTPNEFQDKAS